MPSFKLTYFDVDGGRGEPARLAMILGNIPFEDHRIQFNEFFESRDQFPLRRVPTLSIDGHTVSQSNAITRYVGKLADLYPQDAREALNCDEILEAVEDTIAAVNHTIGLPEQALAEARSAMFKNVHTLYLRWLNQILEARGEWLVGGKLSVADLSVFAMVQTLTSGAITHVPVDAISGLAPKLLAHRDRIANLAPVAAYYETRRKQAGPPMHL